MQKRRIFLISRYSRHNGRITSLLEFHASTRLAGIFDLTLILTQFAITHALFVTYPMPPIFPFDGTHKVEAVITYYIKLNYMRTQSCLDSMTYVLRIRFGKAMVFRIIS